MSLTTGKIYGLDILDKSKWIPRYTLDEVLQSIQILLANPNLDERNKPQDDVVALQYQFGEENFDRVAKYWTAKYAGAEYNSETDEMEAVLYKLSEIGFTEMKVIEALSRNIWVPEIAIQWLLDQ